MRQKPHLGEQLRVAQTELARRRKVLPDQVARQRMRAEDADREIAGMAAIVDTLQQLVRAQ